MEMTADGCSSVINVSARPGFLEGRQEKPQHVRPVFSSRPFSTLQSNEILRENKFYQWTITKKNLPGLLVMTVGFPVLFYTLNKDEQIRRDANYKKMEQPRQYL